VIPYRTVAHSPALYPITTMYASAVAVLVLTVQEFFSLAQGIVLLAVCAVGSILIAAWRDLKSVHTLVNGGRHELMTEIADLKQLLRQANVQVPASPAEKRDQTKEDQ
jgi:hypothetical protein